LNTGFQAFEQHIHETVYHPIMTQRRSIQESFHSDIAALDARFNDLPSSEQYEQLLESRQQLQQSFSTFNTTFHGLHEK